MSNSFYNPSGTPGTGSKGSSAPVRSEYSAIGAGFDKMPALTPGTAVVVNSGGTKLVNTAGTLSLSGNLNLSTAYALTFAGSADVVLTLPANSSTLATTNGTEIFTNKTFDTAGVGNVFKINGTQISAVTGNGAAVLANSPTLVTPALGTPSALMLTNATGLPVASGITGMGSGVASFLTIPSSANLAAAMTDETGSGALVFGTAPTIANGTLNNPTLTTPSLGVATATSINKLTITAPATNATLTIADGKTLTVSDNATVSGTHSGTSSNTNTGDQTITLTGDVTGSGTGSISVSLTQSVKQLRSTIITSTGTFTIPSGVVSSTIFKITAVGGGGGGGGATSSGAVGGGGGSGGQGVGWFSGFTAGNTISITIGGQGSPGSTSPGNGGTGGTTYVIYNSANIILCGGGNGGVKSGGATDAFAGAGGATVDASTSGLTLISSMNFGANPGSPAGAVQGGCGGGNSLGSGGYGTPKTFNGTGSAGGDGHLGGGGGGGGTTGTANIGGYGGSGAVLIEWVQ